MAIHFNKNVVVEDETVYVALRREERRVAAATVELLLDQEHTVSSGQEVTSHLIAIPKGMEVPALLRAVFNLDIFGRPVERRTWQAISDSSITSQYPEHRVCWLCRARDHSAEWVKGVVEALLAPDTAAPKAREIKNKAVIRL